MCKITVFTPTFNREKLLPKLYESLRSQTSYNFEWLIIDDESTDSTEKLVRNWMKDEKLFNIRYIKQNHGGKHRALNRGFIEAKGEYFFIVDSDDYLINTSIEKVCLWIEQIQKSNLKLAGVAGLRAHENGEKLGGTPVVGNKGFIDADCFERKKYNLDGDKAEIFKTDILKQHLFPEFKDEYFLTEAVCWNSIYADGYKLRWYDEVIYKCEYLDGGLTKSGMNDFSGHIKNYYGYTYFVKQSIDLFGVVNIPEEFIKYIKVAKQKGKDISQMSKDLNITKLQMIGKIMCIPVGYGKRLIKITKNEGIKGIASRIKTFINRRGLFE